MDGSVIGAYRVIKKIGEGGMGTVYLGEHTLLGRQAAVKVLRPSLSSDDEIVQRFFNEARAVTRISDPGIVQVFDFGYTDIGSAFIVMELLMGEAMDKRLARLGAFEPTEALRLARLACTSLGAAHRKGIVHRDLKPENLFIVDDPGVTGGLRVKLLDFGIAKLSGDERGTLKTRTGVLMGTPVFMSPEQCRGAGDVDHRTDIYSMGCVLFAMLTGKPPFHGEATGDLIVSHMREPAPRVSSRLAVPTAIDALVQRCLEKNPADRFQSMAEVVDAIDTAFDAAHTVLITEPRGSASAVTAIATASTLAGAEIAAPPAPRRGLRWIGVAAGAIAIGVGAIVATSGSRAHDDARAPKLVPTAIAAPAVPPPPVVVDATVATPDAAVAEVAAPPDAAPRPVHHHPSPGGSHAKPSAPVPFDRSD